MNSLSVVAFTLATMASGTAVIVFIRLDKLEKRLKELGVIPDRYSSLD